jgi:hypothetical protein
MRTKYFIVISCFIVGLLLLSESIIAQSSDFENNAPLDSLLEVVVPNNYAATPGTAPFTGPFSTTARRYQLLVHEDQLTAFVGNDLSSINFRIPTSATVAWPASSFTISSYSIYLGLSVPPANRSLTFTENIAGPQTMVRSGVLEIKTGDYPFGGSPNLWGSDIVFQTPYTYSGGHLLIEIVHEGYTGTSRSVDAIGTSTTGYGTLFSALWASSLTALTGLQGNFAVTKINGVNIIPVELTSFTAQANGKNIELKWTTASETNNRGFEIERSDFLESGIKEWLQVGFVDGNGTTSEIQSYTFTDNLLTSRKYFYRLKQIDLDGTINYSNEIESETILPDEYILYQNYPNPFNPSTIIKFALPEAAGDLSRNNNHSFVTLIIFDMLGNKVATLINEAREPGIYEVEFDAKKFGLSSGVYLYKLTTNKFISTKKFVLMK